MRYRGLLSDSYSHSIRGFTRQISRVYSERQDRECPLVDAVLERAARVSESPFHVPGHKRGSKLTRIQQQIVGDVGWRNDATELEGLDNLQSPEGVILEAMELASQLWNSDHTWFLINGATVGIHAAIMATCHQGEKDCLILARNAHQSAHNGVILAGCHAVYAMPECMHGMAHHMTPSSLEKAFIDAKNSSMQPKAALVVSPTYYGVQSDIHALQQVCAKYNAVLIVDEAHGAHLDFLPGVGGSLQHGANIVIQSTHKQLSSLTQSSMLHAREVSPVLQQRITSVLRMLQSSSPSYLLLSSLDASRNHMENPESIVEPQAAAMHIQEYFTRPPHPRGSTEFEIELLSSMLPSHVRCDPWRFTMLIQSKKRHMYCNARSVASLLEREKGIIPEMATHNAIVFACGIGTTLEHAKHLTSSLDWLVQQNIIEEASNIQATSVPALGNLDTIPGRDSLLPSRPRDVYYASHISIPIEDAEGKIAAQIVTSYPPGIPILLPGETITRQHIDYLKHIDTLGGSLVGSTDSAILVVDP